MKSVQIEAIEFEYKRHGTLALITHFEVATSQVIYPSIGDRRTEEDFASTLRRRLKRNRKANGLLSAIS